jgi:hypothetical protein
MSDSRPWTAGQPGGRRGRGRGLPSDSNRWYNGAQIQGTNGYNGQRVTAASMVAGGQRHWSMNVNGQWIPQDIQPTGAFGANISPTMHQQYQQQQQQQQQQQFYSVSPNTQYAPTPPPQYQWPTSQNLNGFGQHFGQSRFGDQIAHADMNNPHLSRRFEQVATPAQMAQPVQWFQQQQQSPIQMPQMHPSHFEGAYMPPGLYHPVGAKGQEETDALSEASESEQPIAIPPAFPIPTPHDTDPSAPFLSPPPPVQGSSGLPGGILADLPNMPPLPPPPVDNTVAALLEAQKVQTSLMAETVAMMKEMREGGMRQDSNDTKTESGKRMPKVFDTTFSATEVEEHRINLSASNWSKRGPPHQGVGGKN